VLAPFGAIYGTVAGARLKSRGQRARVPVICVGDPTVGGAGKTPTAISIAKLLISQNERPYFVTRGYGGRHKGPLLVSAAEHSAEDVGDEPLLLSHTAPTVISADRVAGAELAARSGASVIILDDGFQNPALEKDFSLLVIDCAIGVGNERVFPAGPLRAPLIAQIEKAQVIVLIGKGKAGKRIMEIARARGATILSAHIKPEPKIARALSKKRVLAFAGIGHPEKFFQMLQEIGAKIVERNAFADHHVYSAAEARDLLTHARKHRLLLVTTEKDQARNLKNSSLIDLTAASRTLPIALEFEDEEHLKSLIAKALRCRRS
jgi:tetraacyldisaccharide 4'-kinase